jgi:hypothetical protein
MEQNNPDSLFELQVDHESRNHFKEATKWSNFIAVIYFVCFGLLVLVMLLAGSLLFNSARLSSQYEGLETAQTGNTAIQLVMGIAMIGFLIYGGLMLLRFSSSCRKGVEMQDQQSFNFGLKGLRNYFISVGIVAVLGIVNDVLEVIQSF